MRLKQLPIAVVAVLTLAASGCDANRGATDTDTNALVVDFTAVARAMGKDSEINANLETTRAALNQQLQDAAAQLNAQLERANQNHSKKPSPKDQENLPQLTERAADQLRQLQQAAQFKLASKQNELLTEFRVEVKKAAAKVARKRGAKVVQLSGGEVLWFDPQADITDEVIAALRAETDADSQTEAPVSQDTELHDETTKLNALVESVKTTSPTK